ncbi:SPOR domain-containing protein [Comamonas sp. lk]|uniref:SPOR domain-containing protein n=1 Tax=Comamonas sp. lk TaxID=2201272 RepID=UPI000EB14809|nr:SPOR domain-containing protein [Comamonas sp. lk]
MLRLVFLLLVLANAGYYLWSHGHLAALGAQPATQSEPQRLQQQIQPDALRVLPPGEVPAPALLPEVKPVTEAESKPQEEPQEDSKPPKTEPKTEPRPEAKADTKEAESCYLASNLDERQVGHIRRALTAKPKSQWELIPSHQGGRWMVYMGKFPDAEFLDRKRVELRLMDIEFDRAGGALEPGLSLGRFSSEEAAQRQLATFARQGVRTARVVQERAELTTYALRLPKATASFKQEVTALLGKNLEAKALRSCPK